MNKYDLEKYQLEKAAIDIFIEIYNKNFNKQLEIVQKQESPDFLLMDSHGNPIGIEIAHVFYDPLEAKMLLNRSSSLVHGIETFQIFIEKFNEVLAKKCKVGESFEVSYPYSLLIRNASPIFTYEDIRESTKYIEIPSNRYKDIWILSRNNLSTWVLMKLDV
ncbi:hypothetical protein [Candidatus Clostridium stratigraminis]|uniref:Uncharacterized protein n=1 Tax=Candidatus Clostridium stratigraminis TaxID=3381661 RepID=A0ABW8T371_9CLOT